MFALLHESTAMAIALDGNAPIKGYHSSFHFRPEHNPFASYHTSGIILLKEVECRVRCVCLCVLFAFFCLMTDWMTVFLSLSLSLSFSRRYVASGNVQRWILWRTRGSSQRTNGGTLSRVAKYVAKYLNCRAPSSFYTSSIAGIFYDCICTVLLFSTVWFRWCSVCIQNQQNLFNFTVLSTICSNLFNRTWAIL